jgi:hypothetical protein
MQHTNTANASNHETGKGAEKWMPEGMHSPQKLAAAFQRGRRKWSGMLFLHPDKMSS